MMDTNQPQNNEAPSVPQKTGLPHTVRSLGVVSFLADVSSEMVYPINPVFVTQVLGAPPAAVGYTEGLAESTASLLKLFSGWLSDRVGVRKPFAVAGYTLGALGKPLIAVAHVWGHVLGARLLDRTGKGLRASPRDALLIESCPAEMRGRAFGFHRSMDTAGAVLGPLIGFLILRYMGGPFGTSTTALRSLYVIAFIPGLLSVLALCLFVHERTDTWRPPASSRPSFPAWRSLNPAYRRYLLVVALFGMGNSSDAFLLLRARGLGLSEESLMVLYALFNVVESGLGYAAGSLSDRAGRRPLIALGYLVFAAVYLGFAAAGSVGWVWFLFPLYGLYYTLTQGTQRALAADLTSSSRRGTEIGAFHMVLGITALPASILAGHLYQHVSPAAPFYLGACTAVIAAIGLIATQQGNRDGQHHQQEPATNKVH